MRKKILYILLLVFFVPACESLDSVKRGLTGEKNKSTDEFFVKKKDPLILPPDYESLPTPDDKISTEEEEELIFENTLETSVEDSSTSSGSVEESILRKIRSR